MSKYGGIPVESGSKFGGIPVGDAVAAEDSKKDPSFMDRAVNFAGELAAGANRSIMWPIDTLASVPNLIPGVDIPNVSETVERLTGHNPTQGGFMEPGPARDATQAAGEVLIPGAMAMAPAQVRNLAAPGGALAEFLGFGSKYNNLPADVAQATQEAIERGKNLPAITPQPTLGEKYAPNAVKKQSTEMAIKRGAGDVAAAGYRLDDAGRVVKDPIQQKAIKLGLDKGVVAQIAAASDQDRKMMSNAMDLLEQGANNKTFGDFNPPRLALGDSLYNRYQTLETARQQAGQAVKAETEALRNVPYDSDAFNQGPLRSFLGSLADLGVTVKRDGSVSFDNSALRGLDGPQSIIRATIGELFDRPPRNAHDLHAMKVWLDEAVLNWDNMKPPGGQKGKVDRVMSDLRGNINQFLRDLSPGYAEANKAYSETTGALDNIGKMIGRNNTATERSLSRAARSALSNAQKSDNTLQMLTDMDEMAKRYGNPGGSLDTQVSFVQTLEKLFPNSKPPASFGGEITKAIDPAQAAAAARGDTGSILGVLKRGYENTFWKTEAERQKQLMEILEELIANGR